MVVVDQLLPSERHSLVPCRPEEPLFAWHATAGVTYIQQAQLLVDPALLTVLAAVTALLAWLLTSRDLPTPYMPASSQ